MALSIFRKKSANQSLPVQTVNSNWNMNPFREMKKYVPGISSNEMRLYSLLRESVPIIDAAINKTVRLVGGFRISCENPEVEKKLNKFLSNIKVNSSSCGAESFMAIYLDQLLTFGTAVGEMVTDANGDTLSALYNANLNDVALTLGENPLDLKICRKEKNRLYPLEYPELVIVSSLNAEPGNTYGTSILKGLPFVSGILLTIYNTLGVNWERVGNLRFAVTYKPGPDAGEKAYAKERVMQVASEWQKTMSPSGPLSDFIAVGDVDIKVIGADNQILDSQIPVRQMLEQIVAKLSIPPFLLGLSWSTTEKMSTQQADILTSELEYYRRILNPVISRICNMWLKLNGYFAEFDIIWDNINLQDEVELANARLTMAKAVEIEKRLETSR